MADFKPSKKTIQDFNRGVKYLDYDPTTGQNGDEVQAETINNVIESQLFTQGLATNAPDVSEIEGDGAASVELVAAPDGSARLKVNNLKGTGIRSLTPQEHTKVDGGLTKNTYELEYTNGTTQKLDIYAESGIDGMDITITDQKVEFGTSKSEKEKPTTWTTTMPPLQQGDFVWTRTTVTYSDGNSTQAYSVTYMGVDGKKGEPSYLHYIKVDFGSFTQIWLLLQNNSGEQLSSFNALWESITEKFGKDTFLVTGNINGAIAYSAHAGFNAVSQRTITVDCADTQAIISSTNLYSITDTTIPISQKGEQGTGIASVENQESRVEGDYTVTPVKFNYDEQGKSPSIVEVKAKNGKNATPITDVVQGEPVVTATTTTTPVTIRTQDDEFPISIMAQNGKDGGGGVSPTKIFSAITGDDALNLFDSRFEIAEAFLFIQSVNSFDYFSISIDGQEFGNTAEYWDDSDAFMSIHIRKQFDAFRIEFYGRSNYFMSGREISYTTDSKGGVLKFIASESTSEYYIQGAKIVYAKF